MHGNQPSGASQNENRSLRNLEAARLTAFETRGYSSATFREKITRECEKRCGYTPKEWQLQAAEAMHLNVDTVLIAGTGSGKTTPFLLPLMYGEEEEKPMMLLISPLIALEEDQV
jgi:ATP-dependent helicase YprA (DUF1998 family)